MTAWMPRALAWVIHTLKLWRAVAPATGVGGGGAGGNAAASA